jgi:VanZ family protein
MRRALLWIPPLVYMAIIFGFSSQSDPMPAVTEHVWDKLLHVTEYAGLAFLLGRALVGEGLGYLGACVLAVVLTSAYGASDEYHQFFVPMRSSDVRDWAADTLGAAVGAIAYVSTASRLRHRRRR